MATYWDYHRYTTDWTSDSGTSSTTGGHYSYFSSDTTGSTTTFVH